MRSSPLFPNPRLRIGKPRSSSRETPQRPPAPAGPWHSRRSRCRPTSIPITDAPIAGHRLGVDRQTHLPDAGFEDSLDTGAAVPISLTT
jgi:hypothetical protein